jgi:hypothetical protein
VAGWVPVRWQTAKEANASIAVNTAAGDGFKRQDTTRPEWRLVSWNVAGLLTNLQDIAGKGRNSCKVLERGPLVVRWRKGA